MMKEQTSFLQTQCGYIVLDKHVLHKKHFTMEERFHNCDVFYGNQTHLGKKSKLSWLLIMKVEIVSFTMIAFLF